ncbi:DUF262 domain-containing protein [Microbacterium sp. X-17]|uniref:DUF262 domain-containing protein n=1 Tax=Microbacterium sp. X-17 TaxID=3144404 RepID=UPI0031F4F534
MSVPTEATATNVDATAVNTVGWLSASEATIVVPVYQRQYRWDIAGCEQLLADVRAVADADDRHMHFIGSILSSVSGHGDAAELVLIDGQQRITTVMLLAAALQHAVREEHPEIAAELERLLVHAGGGGRTKLRPHRAWADAFESVVLDRRQDRDGRTSRFDDNYAFFRSRIGADEAPRIWRGLQKLEHVAITLGAGANAQQIFESLNSTGEPLRDHELIHNYVLMGLTHAEQREIEDEFWIPIEENTGEAIGQFWRHYLVMRTGREVAVADGRGVYDTFRQVFPRLDLAALRRDAAEWKTYSEIYRVLLEPAHAPDAEIGRHLGYVGTFGRATFPLLLRLYRDAQGGGGTHDELAQTLEHVQSMLLRRSIVGTPTDRLVARLCRAREDGPDALVRAIARITPSDERIRVALKFGPLPHAAYVLGRLAGVPSLADLAVEHVAPLAPGDAWTGDGIRPWSAYTEDEQNSLRALAPTLGNLTLLEDRLAERVFDRPFPDKRDAYAASGIPLSSELAETEAWSTAAISARTVRLSDTVVRVWPRPGSGGIDDDDLTPILDAVKRRGWPYGWEREWDYVEYRGEHWEVKDVRHLFHRVFARLWAERRDAVLAYSAGRGGPVYEARAWNGQWEALDARHHLYLGWDSRYMLTAVQGVLEEAGFASEVFVKYSYLGAVM